MTDRQTDHQVHLYWMDGWTDRHRIFQLVPNWYRNHHTKFKKNNIILTFMYKTTLKTDKHIIYREALLV